MTPFDLHAVSVPLRDSAPAIANHLWQSTAFAAAAGLLTLALRRNSARTRYWIWLAASLKFLLPFALLSGLAAHFARPIPAPQTPSVYFAVDEFSEPFAAPPVVAMAAPVVVRDSIDLRDWLPIAAAALWLAGFLTGLTVWTVRWLRILRAVRAADTLETGREVTVLRQLERAGGIGKPARMLVTNSAMEPGVFGIGIFRPVLLWPAGISERLTTAHLEAVLAHEVCHVRRRDNLLAALHMVVEAVFWFHPLVWWMGARLVAERERACDEAVLELCGRPHVYAESILKVCEFCVESPLACVAGITGGDLKRRIVEIMQARALLRLTWAKRALIAAAMVCAVAVPFAMAQANSVRAAQRVMLAAIDIAPKPLQTAAHAMIAVVGTPGTGEIAEAQAPAAPGANEASGTDDTTLGPEFEVATIRPANPNDGRRSWGVSVDASGRFAASADSLSQLVDLAYVGGIGKGKVSGGPSWAASDLFDINAKVDEASMGGWDRLSYDQRMDRVRPMIRTLLAQRFQLKLRIEMQPTPVYALVQAKGGTKMKEVSAHAPVDLDAARKQRAENPGKPIPGQVVCWANTCTGTAMPMSNMLGMIQGSAQADRIVIDETGLKGYYDFKFTHPGIHDPDAMAEVESDLGLKFEPRTVPLKTYVIESAERPSVDGAEVRTAASPLPVAMAQGTPMSTAPPAMRGTASGARFVVSTVKPSSEATSGSSGIYTGHGRLDGKNVTLKRCIIGAYGIGPHQVVGGPDWIDTLRWDIEAKADQDINDDATLNAMQANLCADRFKLVMHKEIRTLPAYVLEIDKGGPKIEKAKGGDSDTEMSTDNGGRANLKIRNTDMDLFAAVLARKMDLPVVNQTGLKGIYNFDLQWTPDGTNAANGPDALSIFTAIQELGLKLRPAKAPVEVLVVDHAELPAAN